MRHTTSSGRHICKPWSWRLRNCLSPTDRSSGGTITTEFRCKPSPNGSDKRKTISKCGSSASEKD